MRIAFITNNYHPYCAGVVRSIDAITQQLQKEGHEICIITFDFVPSTGSGPTELNGDPEYVKRIPSVMRFMYKKKYLAIPWRAKKYLDRYLDEFNPDIVHVQHPFMLGPWARDWAQTLRGPQGKQVPVVFTYHTIYEDYVHYVPLPAFIVRPIVTKRVLAFCRTVDAIIAPSSGIKDYLHDKGIENVTVIPSPIRQEFCDLPFSPSRASGRTVGNSLDHENVSGQNSTLRSSLNKSGNNKCFSTAVRTAKSGCYEELKNYQDISKMYFAPLIPFVLRFSKDRNEKINLITVSRFNKEKNLPLLFEVLKQLPENYHLTLIGYGDQEQELRKCAQPFGARVRFVIQPSQEQLISCYQQAHLFLFSSASDTQGLVLAEAMISSTPVISLDGMGQQDIIHNGENGYIVDSVRDMAAAILHVASSPELYLSLQRGAFQAAQKYCPEAIAHRLIALYNKLVFD